MPVLSIVEIVRVWDDADPSAANDAGQDSKRIFLVTNHAANHGSPPEWFTIPPTPAELMGEVRWYLEEFAVVSPLETTRADRVKQSLKDVGRALVKSIDWASVVGPEGRNESLLVSIQEQPCDFAPVLWELLEDSELWDDPFEGGVFVSRRVPKPAGWTPTETAATQQSGAGSPSLNILVVAARPGVQQDIPHRIVSKILHKIRRQADELALPLYLKILRPPTWEEFNRELETKGPGFYDIVHFDLHGDKMDDRYGGRPHRFRCPNSG